ncbi:MAG: substrate-binding domain-containing protein [Actinomycetota bacterium]|nr:substrate-binding domain-containing protein [Actinomycetota bacterium]
MTQLQQNGYGTATTPFFSVPANLATGVNFVVPGQNDGSCPEDTTWTRDPMAPAANTTPTEGVAPFGSSAGRNYLAAENNATSTGPNANPANPPQTTAAGTDNNCVNVARSSGAPRTSTTGDKLTFQYYAFAMDAVSWASTSVKSPATLTQAQLSAIYDCTTTDWSQVGGTAGTIQRYFPQPGSGTRAFFISDILGKPSSYTPPAASTVPGCPSDAKLIEENEGQQIARVDIDKAILPYSAGVWSNQESNRINPTLDKRVGALLKGITTASPQPVIQGTPIQWIGSNNDYELDTSATGVVKETNVKLNVVAPATVNYPGIRYVFNVMDSGGNAGGFAAAKSLFGFNNVSGGTKSPLCDNQNSGNPLSVLALNLLQSNSFASLDATTNIGGNNAAGATCRFFAPAS